MHLKTGAVSGTLQDWTPEGVTVGTVTTRREDVLKIERYRRGMSRAKRAAFAAAIGFGAGFAAGASVPQYAARVTRPQGGAIIGGAGAAIGAAIFLLIPDSKEIIYSTRQSLLVDCGSRAGVGASGLRAELHDLDHCRGRAAGEPPGHFRQP